MQRLQEVSDRPLLHTRIPGDRAGETGQGEHGREKTGGRPRVPQEQRLLGVDKFTLMPVYNKGRAMLFDSHTEVLEDFTRHVCIVALKGAVQCTRSACQCRNRQGPVGVALRAWHSMRLGNTGRGNDLVAFHTPSIPLIQTQIAFLQLEVVIRIDNAFTFLETDRLWEKLTGAFRAQLLQQTTHAKDSGTLHIRGEDDDSISQTLEFVCRHIRCLAALRDHVDQQGGINSVSDTFNFIDGLRRFNEDDIGANFTTRFAACNRFLEPQAGTGVRTSNDHKVRVAPRRTGRLDFFHEFPPIHHLFAFIVTTTLWRHLIFDMDTSGTDGFHLAHGTHQIDGIAVAGVSIGQDWYRYRFTDHLDACDLLIQRNE